MPALSGREGTESLRKHASFLLVLAAVVSGCSVLRLPEREPAAPPRAAPEQAPLETTHFTLTDPATSVVGGLQVIRLRQKDTFIDVAQAYHLGYDELVDANPGVDPWLPGEGTSIVLPTRFVLPEAPREGLVLNVAAKRLFYFPKAEKGAQASVYTYPISIGREGWATPLGKTKIVAKTKDPLWRVPASIRKEHAEDGDPLPPVVKPGPDNPLGRYAMRLAIPGDYLIHGTNKPAGIGMRMSHGCIRMNPDDIEWLFQQVPIGLPVHIVNQPVLIGTAAGELFLEAHPALEEDKTRRTASMLREIEKRMGKGVAPGASVDYERVARIAGAERGFPVSIMTAGKDLEATVKAAPTVTNIVTYDWFADDEAGTTATRAAGP